MSAIVEAPVWGQPSRIPATLGRYPPVYLADEPIRARPASTSYQLQKFARRHKAPATATAVVIAVLMAGVIVSTREAVLARHAEQTAQAVNDHLLVAPSHSGCSMPPVAAMRYRVF